MHSFKEDSLKKRYFYKLFANLFTIPIALVSQSLITRGLGPKNYGDYNFLTNFFIDFMNFFDSSSSIGFYTKLSQRPKETKLITFFAYFILTTSSAIIIFVLLAYLMGYYKQIWPAQGINYVYCAFFVGVLAWIVRFTGQIADAFSLTVPAELAKIGQKGFALLLVIVLFFYQKLNLTSFYIYNFVVMALLVLCFLFIIKSCRNVTSFNWRLGIKDIREYASELYEYSHPLFVYSAVGFLAAIIDRWLLQSYAGSIEQGFYSLSAQIGVVCFMFSSAMTPLIMREFSIANTRNDINLMAELFRKHAPLLYSITAIFSCFVAVNADRIVMVFGGVKFQASALAVGIMAFFPIHQTYGQLNGSLFYATGQTRLYRNIGIIFMTLGIPLTFFMIAPKRLFGLDAGASGLAIKMVMLQIIAINVQLYYHAKFLKFSFWHYVGHQIICVACLLSLSLLARTLIYNTALPKGNILIFLFISGILYAITVITVLYYFPWIFGINKSYVSNILANIKRRIKK